MSMQDRGVQGHGEDGRMSVPADARVSKATSKIYQGLEYSIDNGADNRQCYGNDLGWVTPVGESREEEVAESGKNNGGDGRLVKRPVGTGVATVVPG